MTEIKCRTCARFRESFCSECQQCEERHTFWKSKEQKTLEEYGKEIVECTARNICQGIEKAYFNLKEQPKKKKILRQWLCRKSSEYVNGEIKSEYFISNELYEQGMQPSYAIKQIGPEIEVE